MSKNFKVVNQKVMCCYPEVDIQIGYFDNDFLAHSRVSKKKQKFENENDCFSFIVGEFKKLISLKR